MMMGGDVKLLTKKLDELLEATTKLQEDVKSLQQQKPSLPTQRQLLAAQAASSMDDSRRGSSPARRRSSVAAEGAAPAVGSGEPLPVLEGDYLVIKDLNAETRGYVTGDVATRQCGVQLAESEEASRAASAFDDYVFQVLILEMRSKNLAWVCAGYSQSKQPPCSCFRCTQRFPTAVAKKSRSGWRRGPQTVSRCAVPDAAAA